MNKAPRLDVQHDNDDYSVDASSASLDVPLAVRAVVTHQPEQWPFGPLCRNCHAAWPCRLCRWGLAVLEVAGWHRTAIADLPCRARAGETLW
ncbi:MAG TPA: hypothetical protein VNV66_20935 [Pilimelia sp.]|nr:hypothetical protein [Pilimelia sp.]